MQAKTIPVLVLTGTTSLAWSTLTTVAPEAGLHLEKIFVGPSRRKFSLEVELALSLPVSASGGPGGPSVSSVSGIGARANASAKKLVIDSEAFRLSAGLNVGAEYSRASYAGSWNATSGQVTQGFQEYSSAIVLEVTL